MLPELRKNRTKYPLVWVEWEDAQGDTGWEEVPDEVEPCIAITAGFLIKETENYLIVASSIDTDNDHNNNRIQIPRGMVRKIYLIRKGTNGTLNKVV